MVLKYKRHKNGGCLFMQPPFFNVNKLSFYKYNRH
jgi:hypothetical protein